MSRAKNHFSIAASGIQPIQTQTINRIARVKKRIALAIVGSSGANFRDRIEPVLRTLIGTSLDVFGFDIRPPIRRIEGLQSQVVRNNAELADRLATFSPDAVYIGSPHKEHAGHVQIALENTDSMVFCEKPPCEFDEVHHFINSIRRFENRRIYVVDHYRLFPEVVWLHLMTDSLIGQVLHFEAKIFETIGVEQERDSFEHGVGPCLYHCLGLAALWFPLASLCPVLAAHANYGNRDVSDTYRAVRLLVRQGTVDCAVGKRMKNPVKQLRLVGTKGEVRLVRKSVGWKVEGLSSVPTLKRPQTDTGYGLLFRALADGTSLPATLLDPFQSIDILKLVAESHRLSKEIPYPSGPEIAFA